MPFKELKIKNMFRSPSIYRSQHPPILHMTAVASISKPFKKSISIFAIVHNFFK